MAKSKRKTPTERKKAKLYAEVDEWQGRIAGLLVFLLLCVHPLYLSANRYIRLTWYKFEFFVIFMCFILFTVLIIWAVRLLSNPRLPPQGKLGITDWAILGFAAVTLISVLLSPYKDEAHLWVGVAERYDGAITQLLYVAIFFIIARWYRLRERHFMLFGVSAILVAVIGILQFFGHDFLELWPNYAPEYYVENFYYIHFRSTLGNTNIVSTYVSAAVILCGYLYVKVKSKWQPIWLAGSALSFWMMILADADSGRVGILVATVLAIPFVVESGKVFGRFLILGASWIAALALQLLLFDANVLGTRTPGSLLPYAAAACILLAAGILLLLFRKKEPDPNGPVKWKLGVVMLAICIAGGIAGVEVLGRREEDSLDRGMIHQAREIMHGNIEDWHGTNRVYIWRIALEAFPQSQTAAAIGTGPDTFGHSFPVEAQGFYGELYDKAHNEYLQILICQGILGLLCYLVFLGSIFIRAIPKAFKNPLLMAVLAAFIGYCAQAFFNISLPIASQMLWVFAGVLASKRPLL